MNLYILLCKYNVRFIFNITCYFYNKSRNYKTNIYACEDVFMINYKIRKNKFASFSLNFSNSNNNTVICNNV